MELLKSTYDEVNKLWLGYKFPYPFKQDVYIGDKIIESLKADPKRLLQISHDEQKCLYAGEFLTSIIRVAQNLTNLGIKSKDVVGSVCLNSNAVSIAINGCILIGAPTNPIDPIFNTNEISHMFNQTRPKLVICDSDVYNNVKCALENIASNAMIFTIGGKIDGVRHFDELLTPTGIEDDFVSPKFDEGACDKILGMICSSGTTGLSKAVPLSHGYYVPYILFYDKNHPPSISFNFSTAFWLTGFTPCVTIGFSFNEVKVITKQRFNIDLMVDLLEKYEITRMFTPPSQTMEMIQSERCCKSENSLQSIMCGGAQVSQNLRENFKKKFPQVKMNVVYGMSEYNINFPIGDQNETSVGATLWSNTEVKIVDDDGNRLGVGEPGELRVRNRVVKFLGYYGNPEATAEAFDDEGFLKSGDIGYFDENRHLYIIDRKKDIFKCKGFQCNPSEIEDVIMQIEGVKKVCVVGVPDELYLARPTAMVVKENGYEEIVTEESVKKFVESKLPFTKHLYGGVIFAKDLPMTASGKIQRKKVLDMIFNNNKS